MKPIILASSSKARAMLLQKLGVAFEQHAPKVDETPYPGEDPETMVRRLAQSKVAAVKDQLRPSNAMLIGSDQTAFFAGQIIGKPDSKDRAIDQLLSFSGQQVLVYTSLCVYDCENNTEQIAVDATTVTFRTLTRLEVEGYVEADQPFDAAGGFHAEGLGIALIDNISSRDPNSLIGLPLIQLAGYLKQAGIKLL